MGRIQINEPAGMLGKILRKIIQNINSNFIELYAGGSSYNGDPTLINQNATHRFVTDTEKSTWSGKASGTHSHAISDVTNLQTTLDAKAASVHTHAISDTTGLQAALDAKAASSHTHSFSSLLTFVGSTTGNVSTGANTTPVSMTDLVFTFVANSKYRIWFMGLIQPGAATTGCGFQFDTSVAVTNVWVQFFHQLANTGTQSGGHSIADDASVGVSSGFPATSTYPVNGFGYLQSGANGGTAQLRLRSETTAAVTAIAGFTLVVEKIA